MWVIILFCVTFLLNLVSNVLVGSLREDQGEDISLRPTMCTFLDNEILIIDTKPKDAFNNEGQQCSIFVLN